jgi:hypothetical protein
MTEKIPSSYYFRNGLPVSIQLTQAMIPSRLYSIRICSTPLGAQNRLAEYPREVL